MSLFGLVERPPLGEWAFDDLRDWALGVLPGWKEGEWAGERALVLERDNCAITLHLGNFAESVHGGAACVFFQADDRRDWSGFGYASSDVREVERDILAKAEEFWG